VQALFTALCKTASATMVGMLFQVIITKIIAVSLGPSGLGLFSILRQLLQFFDVGIKGQTAVIQGMTTFEGEEQDRFIRSSFWITLGISLLLALILFVFSSELAVLIFSERNERLDALMCWAALALVANSVFSFLLSVLNGLRYIGFLAIAQLGFVFILTVFMYPISQMVLSGVVEAFVWGVLAAYVLGCILCIALIIRGGGFVSLRALLFSTPWVDSPSAKHFFRIAKVTFAVGLITAGVMLVIRAMIAGLEGLDQSGIFNAAWALSMIYLSILFSSLGSYYSPSISLEKDEQLRLKLIDNTLRMSLLLTVPCIVFVVVFKPLLVELLFSDAFMPALQQMRWMLIGDYLKVSVWIFTIPALMLLYLRVSFLGEVYWNIGLLFLAYISLHFFNGIEGIGIAYLLMYAFLLVYYYRFCQKELGYSVSPRVARHWVLGLSVIIAASVQTWDDVSVNYSLATFWVVLSLLLSWFSVARDERKKLILLLLCKKNRRS